MGLAIIESNHSDNCFSNFVWSKPTKSRQYLTNKRFDLCVNTCSAFSSIYDSNELFGETINIGMNSEISIEDLAKLLMKLLNVELEISSAEEKVNL